MFFDPAPESQEAGRQFWARRHELTIDVNPPSSPRVGQAQFAALRAWYDEGPGRYDELKRIVQPTLVVHGHRDNMLPLMNAFVLSQHIPNAQLIIYPKSGPRASANAENSAVADALSIWQLRLGQ